MTARAPSGDTSPILANVLTQPAFTYHDQALDEPIVLRVIPLWIAERKEAIGAVRERRAHDYAAALRWRPLLPRVLELEERVRELEAELAGRHAIGRAA